MDWSIQVLLNQQVIDTLDVLVFAGVGGSKNGADTNGVLVNKVDTLLGINDEAILSTENVLWLGQHAFPLLKLGEYTLSLQRQSILLPFPSRLGQQHS
jgi:hypothetical protein